MWKFLKNSLVIIIRNVQKIRKKIHFSLSMHIPWVSFKLFSCIIFVYLYLFSFFLLISSFIQILICFLTFTKDSYLNPFHANQMLISLLKDTQRFKNLDYSKMLTVSGPNESVFLKLYCTLLFVWLIFPD